MNTLCNFKIEESVAFDFDGTIVNCKTRQVEVLQSILRRKDINIHNFKTDKWWEYKTNGLSTFGALIKMQINSEIAIYINKCWIKTVENPEWLDLDVLFDGVIPMLKSLKALGKNIYIITARKSELFFLNQIRKLCIDQYIKECFVVKPINSIEQKGEILNLLKPSLFIGDSENDFYAAQMSGTKFVAVASGQRSKQFLLKKGIKQVSCDFSELSQKINSMYSNKFYNELIHPTAEVQTKNVGEGTMIWQYSIVLKGATIGRNCNINFNVFIENDVIIGDNVTIKSGVQLWDGLRIGNNVFISPNVTFTNDLLPRSKNFPEKFLVTKLEEGVSIGANSTIIGGISIGKFAMIGAGSLVTKNIPDYTLWYGNPAKFKAFICKCGHKLNDLLICNSCITSYKSTDGILSEI